MISMADLETLVGWGIQSGSRVLSVYLNVDQALEVNRSRGFEVPLGNILCSCEENLTDERERREFASAAGRVGDFMSEYKPSGKSLAVFCNVSENLFWQRELKVPTRNAVFWNETPYVRPLMAVMDEFERYGVILTDRAQSRLFTVFMGEIEEHHETFAEDEVRRSKATGTDQMWSQMRFQRKAEERARWHLKNVADLMDELSRKYAFDRLVLAGSVEARTEIHRLLPRRLLSRVVASVNLPIAASEKDVQEVTLAVERDVERAMEEKLVDDLITAAAKNDQAVIGVEATLGALHEGRIWKLVYAEGVRVQGSECSACSILVAQERASCSYCGAGVRTIKDVVARLGELAIDMDGKYEQVRGAAAERLRAAGGVGAFLRY
jgi:peptide chain release factor subunit 1